MKTVIEFGVERLVVEDGDSVRFVLGDGNFIDVAYAKGAVGIELHKSCKLSGGLSVHPESGNVIRVD